MIKKKDVSIIGDICNLDLILAEHLSRVGLDCQALRHSRKLNENRKTLTPVMNYFKKYDPEKEVAYFKNPIDFYEICLRSRLVVSFTLGIISALRYFYFLRFLKFPPIINFTTGSDITELIGQKSILASLYRFHLKTSDLNWCVPYPHALKNIIKFSIPKVIFIGYPFYYLDPGEDINECVEDKREKRKIRFFHPSHLDWKVNDPGIGRNSSKGNDRFLRAFIKAVKNGFPGCCVILDRGPDRDVAKKLILDAGAQDYFIWKPLLSGGEMFEEYRKADVVVDQFDVGGLGAIAIEAMSVGKPVMIYLQNNCQKLLYREEPPVLNCFTEDEIYEQILKCKGRELLTEVGQKAREWVHKYHSWENGIDQFLVYYTLLTGHRIIDYGWSRNAYAKDL